MFKRALNSQDFLQLGQANRIVNSTDVNVLVGHNRWATKGGVNSANAHPFSYGNITLVHNGSLTGTRDLPDNKDFEVDSENIAYAFYKEGAVDIIPKLWGAFSLVWHDSNDNTLNFVRNSERPMFLGTTKFGDIVFGSEELMLKWVCDRNKLELDGIVDLPIGKIHKFHLDKFSPLPEVIDVELKKVHINNVYSYRSWENGYTCTDNIGSVTTSVLTKYKIRPKDTIEFTALSWTPSNSKGSGLSGTMRGISYDNLSVDVVIHGVFEDEFEEFANYEATVSYGSSVSGVDTIYALQAVEVEGVLDEDLVQVLTTWVSRKDYNRIIDGGCAYCASPFNSMDKEKDIKWMDVDTPMHKTCYTLWEQEEAEPFG